MSDLVPFDAAGMPAHLAARFGDGNADLTSNVSSGGYPVVSFKGKTWHVVRGDERTLVANDEGEPRMSLEVVILKANPNLSKIYYPGGFEEGSSSKPTCYSNDSKAPATDAAEPQATGCAICPHNVWGSRMTEAGGKGKRCSDSRRIAIAPLYDLENPMLLRIPAATLKELSAYGEMLNRRKAPAAAVVTKIGFDHTVAHPKLTFKAIRWLTDAEAELVADVTEREVVKRICGIGESSDLGIEGTPPARLVEQASGEPERPAAQPETVERPVETAPVATVIAEANESLEAALAMLDD